ncbi:MAG: efflux RND transporter periplasmic adaptor subunit [Acidobacteriota bacterium]|nr:efflux RND transporter periplasmic adaptor subunit [Acidobacteriota bacterium]
MSILKKFPPRKESSTWKRPDRRSGPGAPFSRLGLALAALAVVALAGCAREQTKSENEMTSFSSQGVDASLFSVPKNQLPRIQIVPAARQKIQRVLRLPGTVGYNMFRTTPVISQVGGPVTRLLAVPGQMVRQGEPLLYVQSPDYSQLRANFLNARDAYHLADLNYKRSEDLYAHQAIAQRDLLSSESARNQAQANLQAAQAALEALGIKDPGKATDSASSQIPVLAPISGEVVERQASPGQLLQAGATQCFTISDMHTVWVLVNVYQKDMPYVRVGESATIETDSYPESFHGRISYLAPALDPNSRTLAARIVTDNPRLELKKDMYVTALLNAGTIPDALVVPVAAVLRDSENHPFVYVQAGEDKFARRLVTIGQTEGGVTQITSGLTAGEKVVGDGSLFLQFANSLR